MPNSESSPLLNSWRQRLARSLHLSRSKPHARYVQLASLDQEGRVHNRTLVFRGFLDGTDQLIMITDTRSNKFIGLQQHPQVEICWYFEKSREQYRINGNIKMVSGEETDAAIRQNIWHNLSVSAKAQFFWYLEDTLVNELVADELIPDTFSVLLLQPQSVDYLHLGETHHRTISQLSHNRWQEKPINP